jgi:predicted negative regulator of RcsB-dependent stress response
MKGQMMSRSTAFIVALIISALIIIGYSYYEYGQTSQGLSGAISQGFSSFVSLFQSNPVQIGILIFIGFIIGYFLGKASY